MTDTGPLFVSSGDLIADRRYKWALDQAARGDFAGAADVLVQTVAMAPGFATAWFALGAIRDRLGDRTAPSPHLQWPATRTREDYHGARLQLARLGAGDATPAMSETYVRRLFDQYAGALRHGAYRTPCLSRTGDCSARRSKQRMQTARRPLRFGAMLDLGCGTGLGGAAFRACGRSARRCRSVPGDGRAGGS